MKNNYFLVYSSCLLLISIVYFFLNFDFKNWKNYKLILVFLLLINLIISILFWKDAKYKSTMHKLDGLFAKLSFIFFVTYILFIKNNCPKIQKIILLIISIITLLLFYLSNKYSKQEWCSRKHVIVHCIFHLFIMTGSLITLM